MSAHQNSGFIGRVGALAVALGVGVGFATSIPGLAWADETDSSSAGSSSESSGSSSGSSSGPSSDSSPGSDSGGDSTESAGGADSPGPDGPGSGDDGSDSGSGGDSDPGDADLGGVDLGGDGLGGDGLGDGDPAGDGGQDDGTVDDAVGVPEPAAPEPVAAAGDSGTDTTARSAPDSSPARPAVAATVKSDPVVYDVTRSAGAPVISATPVASVPAAASDAGARVLVSTQTSVPPPVADTEPDVPAGAARTAPVPPEDLIPAILEIPKAAVDAAAAFVAVLLWPFLGPGPGTPTPPVTLFAVLDWLRREVNRAFFNTAPKAVADEFTTGQDIDTTGNVLANDTDVDGDRLTAKLVTGPEHGELVLNADGSFSYTPDADFRGTDSFTYTVSDGTSSPHLHGLLGLFGQSHTDGVPATVWIDVVADQPPVAGFDSLSTELDTVLTITRESLLANDFDVLGRPLTIQHQPAEYGTLEVDDEGNLVYTPAADFTGADTFEYSVTNSTGDVSDPVVVTIFVGVAANARHRWPARTPCRPWRTPL